VLSDAVTGSLEAMLDQGMIPDVVTRTGVRWLLHDRLDAYYAQNVSERREEHRRFIQDLKASPVAIETDKANQQHYEVDSRFYHAVLGKRLKYSSALFGDVRLPSSDASAHLDDAEERMLALYTQRADLDVDGSLRILDLGCGWGSVSLYLAETFPRHQIVAVSNSATQREWIEEQAARRGLYNLQVYTGNIVSWSPLELGEAPFDRVISIEMLEHMKNYQVVFGRIARWLNPSGLLFVHVFVHREHPYHFEARTPSDWMAKHFFSGGTMPSADLFHAFTDDLALQAQWNVSGIHYSLTAEAWLQNMDRQSEQVKSILSDAYGNETTRWYHRWRTFFMACSELFRMNDGREYFVAHYLFTPHSPSV